MLPVSAGNSFFILAYKWEKNLSFFTKGKVLARCRHGDHRTATARETVQYEQWFEEAEKAAKKAKAEKRIAELDRIFKSSTHEREARPGSALEKNDNKPAPC